MKNNFLFTGGRTPSKPLCNYERYLNLALQSESAFIVRSACLDLLSDFQKKSLSEAARIESMVLFQSITESPIVDLEQLLELAALLDIMIQYRPARRENFHAPHAMAEYMRNRMYSLPEREKIHQQWLPDAEASAFTLDCGVTGEFWDLDANVLTASTTKTMADVRVLEEKHYILLDPITDEGGKALANLHKFSEENSCFWANGYLIGYKHDLDEYIHAINANGLRI